MADRYVVMTDQVTNDGENVHLILRHHDGPRYTKYLELRVGGFEGISRERALEVARGLNELERRRARDRRARAAKKKQDGGNDG